MNDLNITLRVRYSEVDSQGIVFNANYLNYCDIAVTEYFRGMGKPYNEFLQTHSMDFHVIKATVEYSRPARFDDILILKIQGEYAGPRIFWNIEMTRQDDTICVAELVYAAIDTGNGRVRRLSPEIADALKLKLQT
ncbi:MAG: acyl-CoA thioesterase [Spirochaetia bacterium]|nr:acyl-CoA thioesterase [Spirochaetia bacterium]